MCVSAFVARSEYGRGKFARYRALAFGEQGA
jgi:hypothetical protein